MFMANNQLHDKVLIAPIKTFALLMCITMQKYFILSLILLVTLFWHLFPGFSHTHIVMAWENPQNFGVTLFESLNYSCSFVPLQNIHCRCVYTVMKYKEENLLVVIPLVE